MRDGIKFARNEDPTKFWQGLTMTKRQPCRPESKVMIIYPFPPCPAQTGGCVFPPALEDCPLILFHATPIKNHDEIINEGFKSKHKMTGCGVDSVSFAKRSDLAMYTVSLGRVNEPGEYCIFVVRYETLDRAGLRNNICDIHDDTLNPPPEIIGYCIVP